MERVFKAVPADLRAKMEALVHDLTLALEESRNSSNVRRRWGLRRRARSTGNIPSLNTNKHSDDSSSSICDIRIPKTTSASKYQSDSDDTNKTKRFARFSNLHNISNIESDSVNENFVPRINTKRKRKFKRMAIDSDSNPSTSQAITLITNSVGKKKRLYRNNSENRYGSIWCGKRKRSCRERSIDCEMHSPKPRNSKSKNRNKIQSEDAMDCSRISSSSISSSDSETGIITNDEDREGDDEQSDWFGESSWWDDDTTSEDKVASNPAFQAIFHGSLEHLTDDAKRNYRQRIQWIRDGLNGREIRAGRRHVDNKPGYSIITSANEKVSRFLQDPSQSELKLHPMHQPEREKLRRLANLYSLNLKGDLNCPILYKTRQTTQAICVDQVSFKRFADYKRLRRTPPHSTSFEFIPNQEVQATNEAIGAELIPQTEIPAIGSVKNIPESSGIDIEKTKMEFETQLPKFYNITHSKSN
ncbi:G patch domain-containing protein 2-like isoform X2 [Chelonus insularis]|uniref:G patch domain-containing protein 2-like isoform X2 n=1 Tax=Chelonus insularis TaxID=460826 RepID=UPI00158ED658|nr:G patch domain-containing protein 2-like isoform X2 [Chelonus insularis]